MQRQLRLGDILDDYCPRERRVTNHAIVAMLGADVKQTRCTTCDAEHEYKQAKVPRQRRKTETPAALYAAVLSGGPKRVAHGEPSKDGTAIEGANGDGSSADAQILHADGEADTDAHHPTGDPDVLEVVAVDASSEDEARERDEEEDGPVHRPLIRASLPRPEGTPPPQRPGPDFTIRQPGGRPANRFRGRHQRAGGQPFQGQGNRGGNGNIGGPQRGGMMRGGGRPPQGGPSSLSRRNGPGRKRQK
jgi:hypothetical protein